MLCAGSHGQANEDRCAADRCALYTQRAAVLAHDLVDHGETDAFAGIPLVCALAAAQQALNVAVRNAWAVVVDTNADLAGVLPAVDRHDARRVLVGILEQISK